MDSAPEEGGIDDSGSDVAGSGCRGLRVKGGGGIDGGLGGCRLSGEVGLRGVPSGLDCWS